MSGRYGAGSSLSLGAVETAGESIGSSDWSAERDRRDVLVGLDGSHASVVALRWAAWFATATRRRIRVAHAWQHGGGLEAVVAPPGQASDAEAFESAIEKRLRQLSVRELDDLDSVDAGVVAGCRALRGQVASALVKEATRINAGLIAVGARGSGGARRALLGSVSRQLTECPAQAVAVVPDDGFEPHGIDWKALVGVDGSAGSSRALRWAAAAVRGRAEVVAVHAFEPPAHDLSKREVASLAAEVQQRLEEEWCGPLRVREVRYQAILDRGDARDVIGRAAAGVRPAFTVVGSRGLGPVSAKLLGSVTHHLVRTLDSPTVIVPSPRDCVDWDVS